DACCSARPTPPGGELTPPNSSDADIESKISGPSRNTLTIIMVVLVITLALLAGVWVWLTRRRLAKQRMEAELTGGKGYSVVPKKNVPLKSVPPTPPPPRPPTRHAEQSAKMNDPSSDQEE
ncbi:hypothetical protein HDV05_002855, partial [Chytridiales sp. JEL 0842]